MATILSLNDFSASKALTVKTPSSVSPNSAYMGERHTESSCMGFDLMTKVRASSSVKNQRRNNYILVSILYM